MDQRPCCCCCCNFSKHVICLLQQDRPLIHRTFSMFKYPFESLSRHIFKHFILFFMSASHFSSFEQKKNEALAECCSPVNHIPSIYRGTCQSRERKCNVNVLKVSGSSGEVRSQVKKVFHMHCLSLE